VHGGSQNTHMPYTSMRAKTINSSYLHAKLVGMQQQVVQFLTPEKHIQVVIIKLHLCM
jgi:hypothetical protein